MEIADGVVTPVDYKRGRPRDGFDGPEVWPADRAQLAVQALVLREHGYRCEEGLIFYQTTRQRVRVEFDETVIADAEQAIRSAWSLAESGPLPAPLRRFSQVPRLFSGPICLPDEVYRLTERREPDPVSCRSSRVDRDVPRKPADSEVRRLLAPRDDLRPVYLNTQGLRVGKSGSVLQVKNARR